MRRQIGKVHAIAAISKWSAAKENVLSGALLRHPRGRPGAGFGFCWLGAGSLNHTPHPKFTLRIDLDAVNLTFETWKALAEFF